MCGSDLTTAQAVFLPMSQNDETVSLQNVNACMNDRAFERTLPNCEAIPCAEMYLKLFPCPNANHNSKQVKANPATEDISQLQTCEQEEADTRIMLHVAHAYQSGYQSWMKHLKHAES